MIDPPVLRPAATIPGGGQPTRIARRLAGPIRLALALLAAALPALAHTPHDFVRHIALSPDFVNDQTMFGVFQLSEHSVFGTSTDGGRTWSMRGEPMLQHSVSTLQCSPDFANDATVFAGTSREGVFRSVDGGATFVQANTGLPSKALDLEPSADFANDLTVAAATNMGVGITTDGGDTWTLSTLGLIELSISRVAFASPDVIFAGTNTLHRSDDGGLSWTPLVTFPRALSDIEPSPGYLSDGTVAVSFVANDGVAISENQGSSFLPSVDGLTDGDINELAFAVDGTMFCATVTDGCFRSDGLFQPWTLQIDGVDPPAPQEDNHYRGVQPAPDFVTSGCVFLNTFMGLYRSDDRGDIWRQRDVYSQLVNRDFAISPDYAKDRTIALANFGGGMVISERDGLFSHVGRPSGRLTPAGGGGGGGSGLGAGVNVGGVASRSAPTPKPKQPLAWEARAETISNLSMFPGPVTFSPDFANDDTIFYGHVGMWRSTNRGKDWDSIVTNKVIRGLALSPDFAIDRTLFHGANDEGAFKSTDGGDTWFPSSNGMPNQTPRTFGFSPDWTNDQTVFCAMKQNGLYRSTDGGANWIKLTNGVTATNFREFVVSPDYLVDQTLFAGSAGSGLLVSTDGGDTWSEANTGIPDIAPIDVEGIAVSPDFANDRTIFVATQIQGLFKSTDGAQTWVQVDDGLPRDMPRFLRISPTFSDDQTLFLSTHDWIWRTLDGGANWHRLPGLVRVPDTHPQVFYEGTWDVIPMLGNHGLGFSRSNLADDAITYEFTGDAITWYAVRDAASGIARILLDGEPEVRVDLYSATALQQQPVWSRTFDAVGPHVIRIEVTGLMNPSAADAFVSTDGFGVTF